MAIVSNMSEEDKKMLKITFEECLKKKAFIAGILADGSDKDTLHIFSCHYVQRVYYEKNPEGKYLIHTPTRMLNKRFVYPQAFDTFEEMFAVYMDISSVYAFQYEITADEWIDKFPEFAEYKLTVWRRGMPL